MMLKSMLRRDDKGIGAVEFALVAPVLISFVIGISQVGRMFFANADMKSAMAAGARVAELYPVPSDATIIAAVNNRLMRTGARARATPTVVHGTDGNGNAYVELRMTYSVPLEFIFFSPPPVTLHDTRRVFTQVTSANSTTYTTTSASTTTGGTTSATSASSTTSASTSATSAGGTTSSTSATSAGGTTSSTSATSAGGTTSSTSATSAGGSTSATSASSTSASSTTSASSSGNASSGNASSSSSSSNGSSGHAHGDCKKC